MKGFIRVVFNVYRATPLHPRLGMLLSRLLSFMQRRRGMFVHDTGDFRINVDLEQRIDAKIYYTGGWEPDTVATIKKLLPSGGAAIDVGANIGYLTMVMASCAGPTGRVLAFEPTTWTYTRLRANLDLNQMPQVECIQLGLSDRVERCPEADIPYGYRLDGRILTVREAIGLTTLDRYLAEHPLQRLDFIKCDTDGAEEEVLIGAESTLRRFRPAIHLELFQGGGGDDAGTGERILQRLEEFGYRFFHEGTLLPFARREQIVPELLSTGRCSNLVAIAER